MIYVDIDFLTVSFRKAQDYTPCELCAFSPQPSGHPSICAANEILIWLSKVEWYHTTFHSKIYLRARVCTILSIKYMQHLIQFYDFWKSVWVLCNDILAAFS